MSFKGFETEWRGKDTTVGETIKKILRREKPLRMKLFTAKYKLGTMVRKLDVYIERLKHRDAQMFQKVVDAIIAKDQARATLYANEVAEIRKIAKTLMTLQIALEQIQMRVETAIMTGDIIASLTPVIGAVKEVGAIMKKVMPTLGIELDEIQEILQESVTEIAEIAGYGAIALPSSPEAAKILEEAKAVAEQRMREAFPELPSIASPSMEAAVEEH